MSTTMTESPQATLATVDDDRSRPVPEVLILEHSTATTEDVVAALIKAGGCVIRNAVDRSELAAIEKDTRPYIDGDKPWVGDFFPPETRRVSGLAEKSKAFMGSIVRNSLYQDVCAALLTTTTSNWLGEKRNSSTSKPQLNNTIIFSIGPGAADQPLHRDDMIHHNVTKRMEVEDYKIGQDTGIGWFVGGKKTTRENGATRFIPGSHLWDPDTPSSEAFTSYAELEPGDAFMMLSSCFHGGSANTTRNEERLVYSCFVTKGWLRQEENQYLANDPEKLKAWYDLDMIKFIGYDLSPPFLGWIASGTPLTYLFGDSGVKKDMY